MGLGWEEVVVGTVGVLCVAVVWFEVAGDGMGGHVGHYVDQQVEQS